MGMQILNFSAGVSYDYFSFFAVIVVALIVLYGLVLVINLLRDKFISNENRDTKPEIADLLLILNKLCLLTGSGFFAVYLVHLAMGRSLRSGWDFLVLGILLFALGLGFKYAKKAISGDDDDKMGNV